MLVKGKRAHITFDGEALIISRALGHPRLQRTKLAENLQAEFESEGYAIPEIEVLERKISWYRNHAEAGPLEKPWSMAALDEYPIAPAAIPEVLRIWALRMDSGISFTIREAKWAARFSGFVLSGSQYGRRTVSTLASQYARLEVVYQLVGRPFDSIIYDRAFMGVKREYIADLRGFKPYLPGLLAQGEGMEQLEDVIKTLRGGTS